MSLVFQWTTFFCPASCEVTIRNLYSGLKGGKKSLEQQKKTAVFGLHLWVCLSLSKGKTERRCSPVLHHRGLGHHRWLRIQSSRPKTAYKKPDLLDECAGLTHAYTHGMMLRDDALPPVEPLRHGSSFLFCFSAGFHPSAYDEDRSRDAIIYMYMI